jgi:hypothetical protein
LVVLYVVQSMSEYLCVHVWERDRLWNKILLDLKTGSLNVYKMKIVIFLYR